VRKGKPYGNITERVFYYCFVEKLDPPKSSTPPKLQKMASSAEKGYRLAWMVAKLAYTQRF